MRFSSLGMIALLLLRILAAQMSEVSAHHFAVGPLAKDSYGAAAEARLLLWNAWKSGTSSTVTIDYQATEGQRFQCTFAVRAAREHTEFKVSCINSETSRITTYFDASEVRRVRTRGDPRSPLGSSEDPLQFRLELLDSSGKVRLEV
jgi:hypothetical protein